MTSFPLLESLASCAPFSVGQRFSLKPSFVIGRATSSDLVLPPPAGRSQCIVEFRYHRWWLRDIGSADGVFHNGVRLNTDVELENEDVLDLAPGYPFRFLRTEPMADARNSLLETAIAQAPDDPARWQVYADWLLEHHNRLGEDVIRGYPTVERLGPMLGALAMLHGEGGCEIDWHFGLPGKVVIRNPAQLAAVLSPPHIVALMRSTPAFRFIRGLEVDVRSFGSGALVDALVEATLGAVSVGAWPLLEVMHFGPMARRELRRGQLIEFEGLKSALPSVTTSADALFLMAAAPTLEVLTVPNGVSVGGGLGRRTELRTDQPNLIGQLDECVVQVTGERVSKVAVRIENELDRWWLTDLAARTASENAAGQRPWRTPVHVNGRERVRAQLRGGDLVEVVPGLKVQFHAALS